jgi:hypothetical protein
MMEDHSADVVQVWRYSDLTLLHTIEVPPGKRANGSLLPGAARYPFGPRLMPDGSVLMNSFGCGFYRLSGITSAKPKLDNVYTIQTPEPSRPEATRGACSIPTVIGKYWVMPVGRAHTIVVLDVSDPATPREVSRLDTAPDFNPHWSAKDVRSGRIIVGAELGGEQGMYMLLFDERAGGTDMKAGTALLVVGSLALFGCTQQRATNVAEASDAVETADASFQQAVAAKDLNKIMSFYADDAVLMPAAKPLLTGKAAITKRVEGTARHPSVPERVEARSS